LLTSTAWLGGEAVYRYGLGVISLPKTDSHDHDHATGGHGDADVESSHEQEGGFHDNSDGHHDKPVHDNSDGHHDGDSAH